MPTRRGQALTRPPCEEHSRRTVARWTANPEPKRTAASRLTLKGRPMAKKIDGYINLQVPAGAANPSPPIGPALGQRGVNIMEFCKSFNAKTKDMEQGTPIPVKITVFSDRSFTFEMRTPPASYLPQEGGRRVDRQGRIGLEGAGPRRRRHRHDGAGARDRQAEDEGPEHGRPRGCRQDDRRLRPLDGPAGGGVIRWRQKSSNSPDTIKADAS